MAVLKEILAVDDFRGLLLVHSGHVEPFRVWAMCVTTYKPAQMFLGRKDFLKKA